jgi:hypothetical protein
MGCSSMLSHDQLHVVAAEKRAQTQSVPLGNAGTLASPRRWGMWPDMKIVALTFEILGTSYSRVFSHWFDAMDLRRSLRHSALNNGPSVFVNL